jgi:hypothetical protein
MKPLISLVRINSRLDPRRSLVAIHVALLASGAMLLLRAFLTMATDH